MLKIFAEAGLQVVHAGPLLRFTEEGKQIFDEELQTALLNRCGANVVPRTTIKGARFDRRHIQW
eukprot:COSAG01_NODE_1284_length_10902_cov_45.724799_5_plen_64_part_00